MDHQAAKGQSRFFKSIIACRKIQPSAKTRSPPSPEKLDVPQGGILSPERIGVLRHHRDPDTVVAERLRIPFFSKEKDDFFADVHGMATKHRTSAYPGRETRIKQFFQNKRKRGPFFLTHSSYFTLPRK